MNLRESSGIALGAIRANKLRSFLTLLGTIIGVASVIAVVSFVEGLNTKNECAKLYRETRKINDTLLLILKHDF